MDVLTQRLLLAIQKVGNVDQRLSDIVQRLERVESDVKAKISIPCPAEGCHKKFGNNGHRNRHVRTMLKKKNDDAYLLHKKVADELCLDDETESDDDTQHRQPPLANQSLEGAQLPVLALRSGPTASQPGGELYETTSPMQPQLIFPRIPTGQQWANNDILTAGQSLPQSLTDPWALPVDGLQTHDNDIFMNEANFDPLSALELALFEFHDVNSALNLDALDQDLDSFDWGTPGSMDGVEQMGPSANNPHD